MGMATLYVIYVQQFYQIAQTVTIIKYALLALPIKIT
jgi:hypothetical protein